MNISTIQTDQQSVELIVCINSFNQEKYISNAIESALMQDVDFDYLIYIHDDASTDDTQKIIRKYAEENPKKIKTFFQKKNQYSMGINPVLKYMFPRIKSKYIAILNGDDYWTDKSKLQKQYEVLQNDENCMIVHHNCYKIFGNKQKGCWFNSCTNWFIE